MTHLASKGGGPSDTQISILLFNPSAIATLQRSLIITNSMNCAVKETY